MPLKSMNFPLDFKVCFQPLRLNETALKSFGYEEPWMYINGVSNYNDSYYHVVGWGGNKTVKNASEVLHAATYDWTASKVLTNFSIWPQPEETDFNFSLQRLNWVDNCYLLNTTRMGGMKTVVMDFDQRKLSKHNVTVQLRLQGRN